MIKKCILLFVFCAITGYCKGQSKETPVAVYDGLLNSLVSVMGKYQAANPAEKLYLQFDKSSYNLDDTLWFNAYLFNAVSLKASVKSKIVYIEISDERNALFTRRMVFLDGGLGSGYIALKKDDFPEGAYTLRAYTQWMRNFDESVIFKQQFYINDVNKYKWLVAYNAKIQNNSMLLHVQIDELNSGPVRNQPVQLGVKQGDAILRWDKIEPTSPLGDLDLDISPKNSHEPVYATLQKADGKDADVNAAIYKFPLIINRPEKADLQFMPESGYLVAGINTVVGFKAIGEDGKGTDITGTIVNSRNEQVTVFKSGYKGMGSFAIVPEAGMVYQAVVNLPGETKKSYPLPVVNLAGTVLNVVNVEKSDSVTIRISSTNSDGRYMLLGQSGGLVCYAARVRLVNNVAILNAPKRAFASGIVRFTLLNEQLIILNERIIYIDHHDNLRISVTADKPVYNPQDSIALHLEVTDSNGKPVQGHFSMSVVNNLQLDNNRDSTSIVANVLLTSDLKGNIENPMYYFGNDPNRHQALDELMLTQGWTGFDWKNLFLPDKQPAFSAETTLDVGGKVTGLLGKSKGVSVSLIGLRPLMVKQSKSDGQGNFEFKDIPIVDSAAYFLHATTQSGGNGAYAIDLDKPEWPVFPKNAPQLPWYVNANATLLNIADTILSNQAKLEQVNGSGKMLKEVNIVRKKVVKGSHNLNGPGDADQVIDSKDIAKAGKITLLDLIRQQVKGFREVGLERVARYFIRTEPIGGFIFDGIKAVVVPPFTMYDLLTQFTTDDIKGIEVMSNAYTSGYELTFGPMASLFPVPFLEITTRDGIGPVLRKKHPGFVMYRPPLLVADKDFYRPAYPVKNSITAANDQRTTIHWEPNIITNKDGKATITFYAAGQPATYTITTEGSNMNGNVGSSVQKITIN